MSAVRRVRDGLRLAVTTLTVLPVRAGRVDRQAAGHAMLLAPLVGLALGLVVAGVTVGIRQLLPDTAEPALLPAALAVALLALLTRGLHLDGLADTVDGLASYLPAEQARAVMRDGGVGALGAAALVLVLLTQVGALAIAIDAGHGTQALLVGAVGGRLAVVCACTPATPAADSTGLGAGVAGTVGRRLPPVLVTLTVIAAGSSGLLDEAGGPAGAARAAVAVLAALALARVVRRHAVRRLGGITGDVLGALVEVATTAVLVVMALDVGSR